MTSKIFISYYRSDSSFAVERLYSFLKSKVGENLIFRDVNNMILGSDIYSEIREAIANSMFIIVVIGKDFLKGDKIFQENDFVRYEITHALKSNKKVIPLLLDETKMPMENQLPASIKKFSSLSGINVRYDRWKLDCDFFWKKLKSQYEELISLRKVREEIDEIKKMVVKLKEIDEKHYAVLTQLMEAAGNKVFTVWTAKQMLWETDLEEFWNYEKRIDSEVEKVDNLLEEEEKSLKNPIYFEDIQKLSLEVDRIIIDYKSCSKIQSESTLKKYTILTDYIKDMPYSRSFFRVNYL